MGPRLGNEGIRCSVVRSRAQCPSVLITCSLNAYRRMARTT
jgi:hypothetical protein